MKSFLLNEGKAVGVTDNEYINRELNLCNICKGCRHIQMRNDTINISYPITLDRSMVRIETCEPSCSKCGSKNSNVFVPVEFVDSVKCFMDRDNLGSKLHSIKTSSGFYSTGDYGNIDVYINEAEIVFNSLSSEELLHLLDLWYSNETANENMVIHLGIPHGLSGTDPDQYKFVILRTSSATENTAFKKRVVNESSFLNLKGKELSRCIMYQTREPRCLTTLCENENQLLTMINEMVDFNNDCVKKFLSNL